MNSKLLYVRSVLMCIMLFSCKNEKDELNEKGYHVLEKYDIAFKVRGNLVFDKKQTEQNKKKYKNIMAFYRLYPYKNDVDQFYEVSIMKNDHKMSDDEIMDNIGATLTNVELQKSNPEKIRINGKRSIIYRYNIVTRGVQIYTEDYSYFFIIRDFSSIKEKTTKLLNSIKFLD